MNKYNNLLRNISERYGISKGKNETDNEWKARLIYSICGIMAYASLWDNEDDEPVSIERLKSRIGTVLYDYKELYPEEGPFLPLLSNDLENEICRIFLNCGIVYHCPRRISPAVRKSCTLNNVTISRGLEMEEIKYLSGLGFYDISSTGKTDISDIANMFGISKLDLHQIWKAITDTVSWTRATDFEAKTEYLRSAPPYTVGYWVGTPDRSGKVSLLRTGEIGQQIYFLYHYCNGHLEISSLPQWMVEDHNYRLISNACLSEYETLPAIEYHNDDEITFVSFKYLIPPAEHELMKLYSWPGSSVKLPSDFNRILATSVFEAFKVMLQLKGYTFKER